MPAIFRTVGWTNFKFSLICGRDETRDLSLIQIKKANISVEKILHISFEGCRNFPLRHVPLVWSDISMCALICLWLGVCVCVMRCQIHAKSIMSFVTRDGRRCKTIKRKDYSYLTLTARYDSVFVSLHKCPNLFISYFDILFIWPSMQLAFPNALLQVDS